MTQTMNGKKPTSQRLHRPGQRQQERLQRQARRRRRQRIWTSSIVSVVVIALSIVGIVQYQRYSADQAARQQASANATATAIAHRNATATAIIASKNATATAVALHACLSQLKTTPTPTAGSANPPALTGTPVNLSGGLQYYDVRVGCGPAAQSGSNVSLEYTGWLKSTGKKFDSSYDRKGQPLTFQLGQGKVIPGFDQGLDGMKQGGERIIIIPPALGYGAQANGPIPANSVLIFDVVMGSIS